MFHSRFSEAAHPHPEGPLWSFYIVHVAPGRQSVSAFTAISQENPYSEFLNNSQGLAYMYRHWAVLSVSLLLLSTSNAHAADFGVHVVFSQGEIETIRAYYRDASRNYHDQGGMGNSGMGSGRGRSAGSLPPGIAKNLERGKPLPPGIAKRYLPSGLQETLPPARDGYERLVLAGKVLLVDIATRVITDVITDVILD